MRKRVVVKSGSWEEKKEVEAVAGSPLCSRPWAVDAILGYSYSFSTFTIALTATLFYNSIFLFQRLEYRFAFCISNMLLWYGHLGISLLVKCSWNMDVGLCYWPYSNNHLTSKCACMHLYIYADGLVYSHSMMWLIHRPLNQNYMDIWFACCRL